MGFIAIQISPVIENTPHGYHGLWAKDLYKINPYFGTQQDLKDLVNACHERDNWVMVDVVALYVGPIKRKYSQIIQFKKTEHYHDFCRIKS